MSPGSPQPDDAPASSSKVIVVAPARRLRLQHYVWVLGTALVVAALLHWLGPILTPFLIGVMLAYVGKPAVSWMEKKRVPRTVGALLVMLVALVLVLALILVLTPLVHRFSAADQRLPEQPPGCMRSRVA
jgi:predicted PurR-regulated permease PerM